MGIGKMVHRQSEGNQWGDRGGILQQTEANGDQGKGEQSRERPYREDKGSLGPRREQNWGTLT